MPNARVVRSICGSLATVQAVLGAYALFFPRSFFDDFPVGRGWVEALPAYNEHLVRDVGGLFLGTAFVLGAAAVVAERRLVRIALVSFLLFSIPHTVWHLFNLEPYSSADAVGNAVTLIATVVLPLAGLWLLRSEPSPSRRAAPGVHGRIEGVQDSTRNPMSRIAFAIARRRFGQVPAPFRIFAHNQAVMTGYSMHELAVERATKVPHRIKHLATLRAAMLPGCERCLDFGSYLGEDAGVTQDEMREIPRYRNSDAFTEAEKLVMDYATGMSRTPVDVSDELFAQLREHFDEGQLVELTDIIALENYRARFNWAFGLEGQGYSEGAYCVPPETPNP